MNKNVEGQKVRTQKGRYSKPQLVVYGTINTITGSVNLVAKKESEGASKIG